MPSFNPRGNRLSLAHISLVVAPGFILFGYNQAGVGGLLSLPSWLATFPGLDTTNTTGVIKSRNASLQGIVISSFVLAALSGCILCMYVGDKLGRRKSVFLGGALTLLGQVLCSSSSTIGQFVTGRVTIGVAIGIFSSIIPVWQAECSPPADRGKHVVLGGVFISLGYALVSWTNFGASLIFNSNSPLTWRLPLAIPNIFSLVLMSSVFIMPESPRWLVQVDKTHNAMEALSRLKDIPIDDPVISVTIAEIQFSIKESSTKKATLADIFTKGPDKLFYRFCICILVQFYQQMSGANLISVYSPMIFEHSLGLPSKIARILTGGTLTWKFLSSFIAFFTIDRFGRRPLFIISGIGMGTCMLVLCITTGFDKHNLAASYVSVVALFFFNFFVPIGFLGANFAYCAEIAPVSLRVGMSAISTANHWVWNFLVIMSGPLAIASIGHWFFLLFAVIGLSIPVTAILFFPETMGLTLEEIEQMFRANDSPRSVVKTSLKRTRAGKKGGDNVTNLAEK